jgi:type VI secretion system secreted protein VgrG
MPLDQTNRQVSVSSALADDVLLFHRMSGSEELGRLFEYRVQLLSANNAIKIADVLGKPMTVHLDLADGSKRHFNGVVTRFRSTGWNGSLCAYEATLHPWLWLLTRASDCRIFQEKSVIDIVKEVCANAAYGGLVDLDDAALSGTYAALPYCVQYRESDFNFVCRLLEGAGIYFYFRHDASRHTLVLADSYGAHATVGGYETVRFCGENGRSIADDEGVFSWSAAGEIVSGGYTLDDFDFEKAASSTSGGLLVKASIAAGFSQATYERYDYPGLYTVSGTGTDLARARMESLHGQCEQVEAATNARGLHAGALFSLAEHPREDQNREFLVTSAEYRITGDDYGASGSSEGMSFEAVVGAVGNEHSYRPLAVIPKPVVQGPQTAMVVGKAGEEIWTDKYGRVKVQFHWDRVGTDDENSSCWVRVAQGWAGKAWGAMFVPRIGMEVVVSFLEGDPDRPLVTGCVYNSDSMPPYELPGEQTKSTIKSNVSKGGGGFNEIRFEDKKDSEEIFVQAEKDYNRVVKNNDTLKVGFEKADKGDQAISIKNDRSVDVGNDQKTTVGNDQTITVKHDQATTVTNDQKLNVDNNQTVAIKVDQKLDVGGNQTVSVTGDQKVTVSKTIVIEATQSIELKVGSSSVKIEPAKITIKSVEIAVKADANAAVEAGAMMKLKSGAVMTVEGALVKIN